VSAAPQTLLRTARPSGRRKRSNPFLGQRGARRRLEAPDNLLELLPRVSGATRYKWPNAASISMRLGETGMGVVTRVMGMVLAAIAMGMLADGLKAMLPGLADCSTCQF
jgi:hypothetical protein